jgi:membrane associated rhomboid family serine protease
VYLWRAGQLADELREKQLSELQKFHYLLGGTVLHYIIGLRSLSNGPLDGRTLLMVILPTATAAVGLIICFRTNQRGDSLNFVERYICLSVPTMVRVYLISFVAFICFRIVVATTGGKDAWQAIWHSWGMHVFGFVVLVAYFATLRQYIARASGLVTA